MFDTQHIQTKWLSKKLDYKMICSFQIEEVIGNIAVRLELILQIKELPLGL